VCFAAISPIPPAETPAGELNAYQKAPISRAFLWAELCIARTRLHWLRRRR
jgi:hypothetical protein